MRLSWCTHGLPRRDLKFCAVQLRRAYPVGFAKLIRQGRIGRLAGEDRNYPTGGIYTGHAGAPASHELCEPSEPASYASGLPNGPSGHREHQRAARRRPPDWAFARPWLGVGELGNGA
jgi:hypothetical protein